ncbi:MAG: septum formation protein Maf [Candidatus Omnitrophica bacterium CG11_big_fil_rev_8_21_14_0_20_41_12]|nr:MAG: septum formation protein Maf [Candidatus Omnitrophica bacterium CG11_big_fil_rev_8_21_14_0_20_41_12]
MKIYLASKSKARKKLLEQFGLKFKVFPSKVKEQSKRGNLSYAQLVKFNARNKAQEVAFKIKEGLVIAADTICVQKGKIFGKPKNIQDARRMLKKLSSGPQSLYTGLAVIKKEKGKEKTVIDYEKTKVYMDPLKDRQISSYFKKVSPMDKAGSFDIQGKGAFFIKRIDGCFYNVVGLPLRKLYHIFKKLGLFSIICFVLVLCGCSTEYNLATKQEEKYYYNTDKEVIMGQSINRQVEKELKFTNDPLQKKRVEDIGKKIALVSDRKEIDYHFQVLEEDTVNAVSLPGGYVYVNTGLLDKVDNDDELACILAHEIGHIVARHSIKKLQAMQSFSILRLLVAVAPAPGTGEVGTAADVAFTQFLLGYSREDELLADQLGARYAKLAGYDPHAMITFLIKLQDINRRMPLQEKSYFKTHPYVPDRIRVVKQELGEPISFDDYINIEQQPHKQ